MPLLRWIGSNNHKLALCFKHLIPQFPCIFDVDAFLFNLWKHFKYRPLAMSFLGNSADIYGDDHVVPVCPSVTRWTAHERACRTFFKGYRHFLSALSVCCYERKEAEPLGLFIQATSL